MQLSKKLRKAFTRVLIDSQVVGKPFSRGDMAAFRWLTGIDADSAVKTPNPEYPFDSRHVYVDGRSLSWNRAIEGYDDHQKLKRTMRSIIRQDLRDFLSAVEPQECSHCGAVDDLTADHADVPFDAIASDFISKYGPIAVEHKANGVGDRFSDAGLEASWIAYHAANATYQVLCRSCNASKGKRQLEADDQQERAA